MPESRDRLMRQVDVFSAYRNRLRNSSSRLRIAGRINPVEFVLEDEADGGQATETPFRWRDTAMAGTSGQIGVASGRGIIGTPSIGRVPSFHISTSLAIGRENSSPSVGSGRGGARGGGRTVLPSWYPRRPLHEITAAVRTIERRAHRGESEGGLQSGSPMLQDRAHESSESTSDVHLEHDISMISPHPTIRLTPCPSTNIGKVPKILLNITKYKNNVDPSSECITPQKKLLDNIDTVEKEVMEELHKLKRTPSAKKVEREKKVRTLMSMR